VSEEQKVRYVVVGGVRKDNMHVRINVQLVDTVRKRQSWADSYDGYLGDKLTVQMEMARKIAAALKVRLTPEEMKHMERPYTNNAEAWDLFMRGTEFYRHYSKEANAQARELFERAITLDPQFARAYANLAATHRQDWTFVWTEDLPAIEQRAFELAQRSVALDPSLPYGHVQLAYIYVYRWQHDDAIREAREAIQLGGPNFADGYAVLAQVLSYAGQPQEAISLMENAISRNPKVPAFYRYHLGQAYYVMGQYQKGDAQKATECYMQAETHLKEAMNMNRAYRPPRSYLVAVYMETGREPEARAMFDEFPDMRPLIDLNQQRQVAPYKDQWIRNRYIDALRRAGSSGGTP
jgi:adenylate cyclase